MTQSSLNPISELSEPLVSSLYNTAFCMIHDSDIAIDVLTESISHSVINNAWSGNGVNITVMCFKNLVEKIRIYHGCEWDEANILPDIGAFYLYDRLEQTPGLPKDTKIDVLNGLRPCDIKNTLDNIPLQLRMVILLSDIAGFSYDDISIITGYNRDTVCRYLCEGRKLMQFHLWNFIQEHGQ